MVAEPPDGELSAEAPADTLLYVSCRGTELKLTAKAKALGKPFLKAIVEPFLSVFNKKLRAADQVVPLGLEAVFVEGRLVRDIDASVGSILPRAARSVNVELCPREARQICVVVGESGSNVTASLKAEHVHLPLRDCVLVPVMNEYKRGTGREAGVGDITRVEMDDVALDPTLPARRRELEPRARRRVARARHRHRHRHGRRAPSVPGAIPPGVPPPR